MKILLLSNKVPYPANDGSSIAMASSVDMLLHQGAEVHLLSLNTKKHFKPTPEIKRLKPDKLHFHSLEVNTNISFGNTLINVLNGKAFHVSRFKKKSFTELIIAYLKKHEFDWIQLEGLAMAVYLRTIRKYSQAKVSLRAHNVEYVIWKTHLKHESNSIKKTYLKLQTSRLQRFEKNVLKRIDALLPITAVDAETFASIGYTKPMHRVPCGIEIQNYEVAKTSNSAVDITYLASMDWMPNLQGTEWFVKKVWPHVQKLRPDTKVHIAGKGMPQYLRDASSENLKLDGFVKDMRQFMNSGKITMVPLLAGSGMRIKVLENLASGRCMVSTAIGAEGIPVTHGKNILIANKPKDFAEQLVKLLEDQALQQQLSTNARKLAENSFSNQKLGKQLLEFYQAL